MSPIGRYFHAVCTMRPDSFASKRGVFMLHLLPPCQSLGCVRAQIVGRTAQVASKGNFFTGAICGSRFIVCRAEDDQLHAYHNVSLVVVQAFVAEKHLSVPLRCDNLVRSMVFLARSAGTMLRRL